MKSDFFIDRPVFSTVLSVIIVIVGVIGLALLPIDTLKIDRHFIGQLVGAGPGGSVVRTIIALAGTFGMTTVAEGVETAAQLQMLAQLGCHQSQGYLHSAAVPAAVPRC